MLWERQSSWRDDREARIKELEERLARLEEHNKPSPVVEHLKPGNELVIYSQVIAGVVNALWLYFFGGDLPPEMAGGIAVLGQLLAGLIARQQVKPLSKEPAE